MDRYPTRRLRRFASLVLACGLAVIAVAAAPATADSALPDDPNAKGYIGICDRNGHNVTGGSTYAVPFVWKAVASQPPPENYLGNGENVDLLIFQLRPGVLPGDWSGEQLTAASYYTSQQHPAAIGTTKDEPLATVIQDYPPMQDGLYQLRMYYGRENYGLYSATYPATYIRVEGDHWTVVGRAGVDCSAARAQSSEVIVGSVRPKDSGATPGPMTASSTPPGGSGHAPAGRTDGAGTSTAASAAAGSSGSPRSGAVAGSGVPVADGSRRASSAGTSATPTLAITVAFLAVALALGGAGWWLRRRRREPSVIS